MEVTTSSSTSSHSPAAALPVVAITVGVVGGVLFSLILVILVLILALLVFKRSRTQSFVIQGTMQNLSSALIIIIVNSLILNSEQFH